MQVLFGEQKSGVHFLYHYSLKALPVYVGGFTSIPSHSWRINYRGRRKLFEFAIGPLIGGATENWFGIFTLLFLVFRLQGLSVKKSSRGVAMLYREAEILVRTIERTIKRSQ